jgi:hypothetical protein
MRNSSLRRRVRPALTLLALANAAAVVPLAGANAGESAFVERLSAFGAAIGRAAGSMQQVFMSGGRLDLFAVAGAFGVVIAGIAVLRVLARCLGGSSDGQHHRRPV